jgi:hypothetical protein
MNIKLGYLSQARDKFLYRAYQFDKNVEPQKITQGFIFIIGASGSGTTMLTRILSEPEEVIGLGGNFDPFPKEQRRARALGRIFREATKKLWDRKADYNTRNAATQALFHIVNDFFNLDIFNHATHILHKRSAPFLPGDRYRPDLSDLFEIFYSPKIIVIYRDPKESTYSSLRRGFSKNLRESAVICEDQLTYLNAQIATLDKNTYRVATYENFCTHPVETAVRLAEFCELPVEKVRQSTLNEKVTPSKLGRWRTLLSAEDVQYLDVFFDDRRQSQWSLLSNYRSTEK